MKLVYRKCRIFTSFVSLKCEASKSVAVLLGINLSPPGVLRPGVPGPSLPGLRLPILDGDLLPSLEGDLLGVLDGVFLVRDSLSLLSPDPPPPSLDPFSPE